MSELEELEFHEKSNDLYKFSQSSDLQAATTPCIRALRELMGTAVKDWLQEVSYAIYLRAIHSFF